MSQVLIAQISSWALKTDNEFPIGTNVTIKSVVLPLEGTTASGKTNFVFSDPSEVYQVVEVFDSYRRLKVGRKKPWVHKLNLQEAP